MHLKPAAQKNSVELVNFNFARLPRRNDFKCPHCDSIVYSRKSRFCGVCGHTLPENFLFSPQESASVRDTLRDERARHRQWLLKRDEAGWNLIPAN